MVNMYKISLITILMLCSVSVVHAKPSSEIIEKRANEIYKICQSEDLVIKEGFLKDKATNEKITKIDWPWTQNKLKVIVELLGSYEPYVDYKNCPGKAVIVFNDQQNGCEILKCGEHHLDITDRTYLLDDIEISAPPDVNIDKIEFNNCKIDLQVIKKENFWLTYIFPGILALVTTILGYIIINPQSKKRRRLVRSVIFFIILLAISYFIVFILGKIV